MKAKIMSLYYCHYITTRESRRGHELTQMSFDSRVNSVIVSCEFDLAYTKECELWVMSLI